jgi:hypothetical protein
LRIIVATIVQRVSRRIPPTISCKGRRSFDEARALVKCASREGNHGLAAIIAVAWDSSVAPIDALAFETDTLADFRRSGAVAV